MDMKRKAAVNRSVVKRKTVGVMPPAVRAAYSIRDYSSDFGGMDIVSLVEELAKQIKRVNVGDLREVEATLIVQSLTLDAVFHRLLRGATMNLGHQLDATETYLRLAFRAQSGSRATLETLGLIKNPKSVEFVTQKNIAHNQQVNNSRTRKKKRSIKLVSEVRSVDREAACPSEGNDSTPQTVVEIDRPQNGGGKSHRVAQRRQGQHAPSVTAAAQPIATNRSKHPSNIRGND
jgi:hypothetical protein